MQKVNDCLDARAESPTKDVKAIAHLTSLMSNDDLLDTFSPNSKEVYLLKELRYRRGEVLKGITKKRKARETAEAVLVISHSSREEIPSNFSKLLLHIVHGHTEFPKAGVICGGFGLPAINKEIVQEHAHLDTHAGEI